jgi:uncharacterized membrane protein YqjE
MDESVRAAGGTLGEYTLHQGFRERPMTEVVKDIVGNLQEMVRSEVRLARVELREEAAKTYRAGTMLAAGGALGMLAAISLLAFVAQLLDLFMPDWAAALLLGVVLGIAAIVLISKGRARLHVPLPGKTIENVKENIEWMKNQTKL